MQWGLAQRDKRGQLRDEFCLFVNRAYHRVTLF
jgi:hypothetical protein